MSDLTLSLEEYLALSSLAREGSTSPDQKRVLETFLKTLDERAGISRYLLVAQWQELRADVPPTANFPTVWPPEMRLTLERSDRPIAKSDVISAVNKKAKSPTNIMVTKDPGGIVGWTKIDDFFIT